MKLKTVLLSAVLFLQLPLFAQENKNKNEGDSEEKNHHCYSHFVGVQANQLIRQVFNFSNNNPTTNNPYLFTYTLLNNHSKWGVDAGFGYTYNNLFENDGTTKKETFINELSGRIGVQKLIILNRRFSTQLGLHAVVDYFDNKTNAEQSSNFQILTINSTSKVIHYGGGPTFGIRYKISNRVFVGTEANYYFKMGTNKSKVTQKFVSQGQSNQTTETNSSNDLKTFIFNVPAVIYLTLRF